MKFVTHWCILFRQNEVNLRQISAPDTCRNGDLGRPTRHSLAAGSLAVRCSFGRSLHTVDDVCSRQQRILRHDLAHNG